MNPEEDGITHINVYSKGKTELGRWLSNFAESPILTEDGLFFSVEGYWYWLLCDHPDKDKLRRLSGYKAKHIGRELKAKDWDDSEQFKNKIKKCLLLKVNQELPQFIENKLPFEHYYVYGGKVVKPNEGKWIIEFLESLKGAVNESK